MSKEAYYFSHDSNAHKDPKCIRLRRLAGMEGYGLFWCLIEMLRDAPDNKIQLDMVDDILFELRSETKTLDAIFQAGLLAKDQVFFWSDSLCRRMDIYGEILEARSKAGKASAEKRAATKLNENSTHVQHMLNTCSTDPQQEVNRPSTKSNKGKERKGKETKEKITREIDQNFLNDLAKDYPRVSLESEKKLAEEWILDNPGRKFSRSFFRGWVKRASERMPLPDPNAYHGEFLNAEEEEIEKAGEYYQRLIDAEAEQERLKKEVEGNEIDA